MPGRVPTLDLLVLTAYFAVSIGVGLVVSRRSRTVEGFTAANRSLPGWLTGLSILGTYVSSITFLALPAKAYAGNWNTFVFSLTLFPATIIAVRWFLPFYRQSTGVSAYEHLETRFGPWARTYASGCYLLTQLARTGTVLYLMALPMHALLGWDIRTIILVTGLSVSLYALVGGIVAVIYTDAIQTIVLMTGAIVCAGVMIAGLPGGSGQFLRLALEHNKLSLGDLGTSLSTPTVWVVFAYGLAINLQNFGIDQNYVQRYVASRSDADARRSVWLGGLTYVPLSAVFLLIGTALFAFYDAMPQRLDEGLRAAGRTDAIFPHFIVTELPTGLTGLLIASIFAAAMSTVSTCLNSSATILLNDYYRRFWRSRISERHALFVLRTTTLLWGLAGTGVAVAMMSVRSALDAWWMLAGVFGGGTLGLFLLGFVSTRVSSRAAAWAVGAGVMTVLWMTVTPGLGWIPARWRSPFHEFLIIVAGTLVIVTVGFLLSLRHARRNTGGAS